jgi:hypothetical protein
MLWTTMQKSRKFQSGIIPKQLVLDGDYWNFLFTYMIQKWVWSSLLHRGVLEDSYKIYFMIFGYSYKFLQILEVWTNFYYLKQLKNDLKSLHSTGLKTRSGYQPAGCGGLSRGGGRRASGAVVWRSGLAAVAACARALSRVLAAWWRDCRRPDGS